MKQSSSSRGHGGKSSHSCRKQHKPPNCSAFSSAHRLVGPTNQSLNNQTETWVLQIKKYKPPKLDLWSPDAQWAPIAPDQPAWAVQQPWQGRGESRATYWELSVELNSKATVHVGYLPLHPVPSQAFNRPCSCVPGNTQKNISTATLSSRHICKQATHHHRTNSTL
jgi:hypothetical protein